MTRKTDIEHIIQKNKVAIRPMALLFAAALYLLILPSTACVHANVLAKDYMLTVKKAAKQSSQSVVRQGDIFLGKGLKDKALVYYMVVCNRYQPYMNEADRQTCATAHVKAGNVYYQNGSYANALELYINGLKIYETCKNQKSIARFYNNIGSIYCVFQDFEKGMSYYKAGYVYSKKYKDSANEYKLLVNMTGICTFQGNTADARKYHRLSEKLKDPSSKVNNFMSRFNFGLILVAEKRYKEAVALFRKQLSYAHANKLGPEYLCSAYKQMYKNFSMLGQRDSTLAYLKQCEHTARKHGILHSYPDVLNGYSQLYKEEGNIRLANTYLAQYVKLKDSIYNMREFDIVKNTQFQYEMDKTNKQIADFQTKENERLSTITFQRRMIIAVSGVTLVIALLLAMMYRQKKKLNKSYSSLFAINNNFISQHEQMKQRLRDLHEKFDAIKAENHMLRQQACGTRQIPEISENSKYCSSNLNDSQKRVLIDAVVNVMENTTEFCSPEFSLDRMATLIGSNSKYVSQVINDTFHKNFTNYVNEYRIHLACLRLSDPSEYGNLTIRAVAESTGFKSYTAFIAVFRKVTGITPSLYQKKATEKQAATL